MFSNRVGALFLAIVFVAGCGAPTGGQLGVTDKGTAAAFAIDLPPLAQTVMMNPDILGAKSEFEAAQHSIRAVLAQQRVQLSATTTAGRSVELQPNRPNLDRDVASLGVNASLLLADGGQLAAQIALAQAQADAAGIKLGLALDQVLGDLAQALVSKSSSEAKIALISNGLAQHAGFAAQIDAAAAAGVLTNAELSRIQLALNSAQTQLLDAQSARAEADIAISMALLAAADPGNIAVAARRKMLANLSSPIPDGQSFAVLAEAAGMRQAVASHSAARAANRPRTHLTAALTAPATTAGGITGFAGVRIELPIYDGGAAKSKALAQGALVQVAEAGLSSAQQRIAAQDKITAAIIRNSGRLRALLQDRLDLARARFAESQGLMAAGRVDIAALAQSSLSIFETELALENLDLEVAMARLSRFSTRGASCVLFDLCDLIDPIEGSAP